MAFDLQRLKQLIDRHGRVARIVITDVRGSTPRTVGTEMFVWDNGQDGTIGGGALEYQVTNAAEQALKEQRTWAHTYPLGPNLGQCCGGSVGILCEVFDHTTLPTASADVVKRPASSQMKPINHSNLTVQNGEIHEPMRPSGKPIWIWGAGHVGRALIHVLQTLPQFDLTWIDFDQGRFPPDTDPSTTVIQATDMPMLVPHAPTDTHHFILTHSHDVDLALCHALLKHDFEYAGLIGSDTKWSRFRKRLTDAGLEMSDIERITCPIGRPEYGKHPSEIAIGILCNLLSDEQANTYGDRVAR